MLCYSLKLTAARLWLIPILLSAALACAATVPLPPELESSLGQITPAVLESHVFFLASDLLEGRATPGRGAELAAEYIASQFRRYGLRPLSGGTYFQDGQITPPRRTPATAAAEAVAIRNVIGILPGSDPRLSGSCVLVTAHYDHLGVRPQAGPDPIFNGANDNASGVAAMLEIAGALSRLPVAPRRTLVFIAFAGEERGRLGSRYYLTEPVCPLEATAAVVNLEQLGRTDDVEGSLFGAAYVTGYDYSDVGPLLAEAAKPEGVAFLKHPTNSDKFFRSSDNIVFAEAGIPAHTVSVGYVFPDYHRPTDHWDKLDYRNMARVVRALVLGILHLAQRPSPPAWTPGNRYSQKQSEAR